MTCAGALDTGGVDTSSSSQGQPGGEEKGKIPREEVGAGGCGCAGRSGLTGSRAEGVWQRLTPFPEHQLGHAVALGCGTPGHPGSGSSPSPAPWAPRSPGEALGQGWGAAPWLCAHCLQGWQPLGWRGILVTAPGRRAPRGGMGLSPTPAQRTVGLGPCHGCAGLGLSPAELPGAPVLLSGDKRVARGTAQARAHSRSPARKTLAWRPLLGRSRSCPSVRGAWPGCPAVARYLGPGAARLGRCGGKPPPLLGFPPARCWVTPRPNGERS